MTAIFEAVTEPPQTWINRVVDAADDHGVADVDGQHRGQVAQPLEVDPGGMDLPRIGHGAGKAIPAAGQPSCFGYVQTYDTKPRRRLFEVLRSQGMQANQQVAFLTDGGEEIRDIPCCLNAQAEHPTGST